MSVGLADSLACIDGPAHPPRFVAEQVQLAVNHAPDLRIDIAQVAETHLVRTMAAVLRREVFRGGGETVAVGGAGKQPFGSFPVEGVGLVAFHRLGMGEIIDGVVSTEGDATEKALVYFIERRSRTHQQRDQKQDQEVAAL